MTRRKRKDTALEYLYKRALRRQKVLILPLTTISSKFQIVKVGSNNRSGRLGFRGVVAELYRSQGVAGFYRGITPNLLKVVPSTIVAFHMYEFVRTRILIERSLWIRSESPSVS